MNKIFSISKNIWASFFARYVKTAPKQEETNYFYIRYYSKKDNTTIERITYGKPKESSKGTMLYEDVLKKGLRSFSPENLREMFPLTQKQFEHYLNFLQI